MNDDVEDDSNIVISTKKLPRLRGDIAYLLDFITKVLNATPRLCLLEFPRLSPEENLETNGELQFHSLYDHFGDFRNRVIIKKK